MNWPGTEVTPTGPNARIQESQSRLRPPVRRPVPAGSNAPALMAPRLGGPGERAASLDRNRQRDRNAANFLPSLAEARGRAAYHPERTLQDVSDLATESPRAIARGLGGLTGLGQAVLTGRLGEVSPSAAAMAPVDLGLGLLPFALAPVPRGARAAPRQTEPFNPMRDAAWLETADFGALSPRAERLARTHSRNAMSRQEAIDNIRQVHRTRDGRAAVRMLEGLPDGAPPTRVQPADRFGDTAWLDQRRSQGMGGAPLQADDPFGDRAWMSAGRPRTPQPPNAGAAGEGIAPQGMPTEGVWRRGGAANSPRGITMFTRSGDYASRYGPVSDYEIAGAPNLFNIDEPAHYSALEARIGERAMNQLIGRNSHFLENYADDLRSLGFNGFHFVEEGSPGLALFDSASHAKRLSGNAQPPAPSGPATFFHGTHHQFDSFRNDIESFFTQDEALANQFGRDAGGRTLRTNLNLEKTYQPTTQESMLLSRDPWLLNMMQRDQRAALMRRLQSEGYDSIEHSIPMMGGKRETVVLPGNSHRISILPDSPPAPQLPDAGGGGGGIAREIPAPRAPDGGASGGGRSREQLDWIEGGRLFRNPTNDDLEALSELGDELKYVTDNQHNSYVFSSADSHHNLVARALRDHGVKVRPLGRGARVTDPDAMGFIQRAPDGSFVREDANFKQSGPWRDFIPALALGPPAGIAVAAQNAHQGRPQRRPSSLFGNMERR